MQGSKQARDRKHPGVWDPDSRSRPGDDHRRCLHANRGLLMPDSTRHLKSISTIAALSLVLAACTSTANSTTTTTVLSESGSTTSTSTERPTTTALLQTPTTSLAQTTTTTEAPTTTTTEAPTTTTTVPLTTTTTIPIPEDNQPPTLELVSPVSLASYTASYDPDRGNFGANVALSAIVSDLNGDAVTVTWSSSTQGGLGTGESIVAWMSTGGSDASQPVITATAADIWGASTAVSVQIIVWIPSDT
jgi:hypothetical protein